MADRVKFLKDAIPKKMALIIKTIAAIYTAMSDLSELQNKSDALSRSVDRWNVIYIGVLVFALMAGALTLVATQQLISRGKKLASVNSDIAREKESASNERAAKLEKEAAELRVKAADAEKSLIEVQEKLRPRHLPERDKFVSFLKGSKSGSLQIQYSSNNVESRLFAAEIEAAFKDAGWNEAKIIPGTLMILPQPVGLVLQVHSSEYAPEYAGAVQQAFNIINFPIRAEVSSGQQPNTLVLVVGAKP